MGLEPGGAISECGFRIVICGMRIGDCGGEEQGERSSPLMFADKTWIGVDSCARFELKLLEIPISGPPAANFGAAGGKTLAFSRRGVMLTSEKV